MAALSRPPDPVGGEAVVEQHRRAARSPPAKFGRGGGGPAMANDEYDALHAAANVRGGTVGCPCALPSYGFCHGGGFSDFRGVRLT
uniref:Uncharacterized protein n=1 Tax=Oryza nivara TaxID=4536 RepID=A0A0E0ITJ5_ORYNI